MKSCASAGLLLVALALASCGNISEVAGEGDGDGSKVVAADSSGNEQSLGKPSDIQIVGAGYTQLPPDSIGNSYITYGAVVKNLSSGIANRVTVNLTLKDAAGTVVKAVSESISFILPGQANAIGGSTDGSGAVSLEVKALADRFEEPETETGMFTVSGITTKARHTAVFRRTPTLRRPSQKTFKTPRRRLCTTTRLGRLLEVPLPSWISFLQMETLGLK